MQKLIWIDTQGCLTHIIKIFKFGNVSGSRAKKWPKVNCGLKIVNYFTCMRHFFCRWYRPPEVDLNGYPRISNPYCCDIQIRRCQWTQGKKMTQSKSQIKGSKGSVGGYPPHIYHHIFWQYAEQYVGPIFSWEKINEYFCYHPEIFLGVFYDNLC